MCIADSSSNYVLAHKSLQNGIMELLIEMDYSLNLWHDNRRNAPRCKLGTASVRMNNVRPELIRFIAFNLIIGTIYSIAEIFSNKYSRL